jgi:hypothetical protein
MPQGALDCGGRQTFQVLPDELCFVDSFSVLLLSCPFLFCYPFGGGSVIVVLRVLNEKMGCGVPFFRQMGIISLLSQLTYHLVLGLLFPWAKSKNSENVVVDSPVVDAIMLEKYDKLKVKAQHSHGPARHPLYEETMSRRISCKPCCRKSR